MTGSAEPEKMQKQKLRSRPRFMVRLRSLRTIQLRTLLLGAFVHLRYGQW
jgi:hypothetical protein